MAYATMRLQIYAKKLNFINFIKGNVFSIIITCISYKKKLTCSSYGMQVSFYL